MALQDHLPTALHGVFGRGETEPAGCDCEPSLTEEQLDVDATACDGDGRLETSRRCRETVVAALTDRDVAVVRTETEGLVRTYDGDATDLLVAAGRFVERSHHHDKRLAARARRDPLGAAREATDRADAVADLASATGLAECASGVRSYEEALAPAVGPPVSRWRVEPTPPPGAELADVYDLETGATVRRYRTETGVDRYTLLPAERSFSSDALATLARAAERLARGEFAGGDRAPARAVRAVREEQAGEHSAPEEEISAALAKHARGFGLLEDLFADPAVSDVFVTAPATSNRLRVTADGDTLATNVRLTVEGVDALASRFRRESGRAFSRADPTLDATADVAGRHVRVAGVTEPPSTGTAFAFRARDGEVWTVPALVANGTLSARAAAVLSVAVERGSATLFAGPRGAGKTTLLAASLWELSPAVRTVVIEDTPELPVERLQASGRDVQPLLASTGDGPLDPAEALRTALRLGDGAIAVGEVRGEEASVLYEAMRVGANSEAVLGTIHGDGGDAVFDRVVQDLGVAPSAFGATDLLVTAEVTAGGTRRVASVEEVCAGESPEFETLFERTGDGLAGTGRIDRGNSELLAGLAAPGESYAEVREQVHERTRLLDALAGQGRTGPDALARTREARAE